MARFEQLARRRRRWRRRRAGRAVLICALQNSRRPAKRASCAARAACTRARMAAERLAEAGSGELAVGDAGRPRRGCRCGRAAGRRRGCGSAGSAAWCTSSACCGVAEVAAGAGVHRGDQHDVGGEADRAGGAGDGDAAFLERLAQDLEDVLAELRQLVEEEHAVVGERDLAGAGDAAAADQAGVADRVMRGAERARGDQRAAAHEAEDAVHARRLDRLFERQRRQDGGQALGQHGLSRRPAGRP